MSTQDTLLFSLAPPRKTKLAAFAEPDWRGGDFGDADDRRMRPLSDILAQVTRLSSWIGAGEDYGWLGAYQARRAAFELQAVRAQIADEIGRNIDGLSDESRLAVQARLDRLQACLEAARAA
jgi:hypothetical protein